MNMDEPFQLPIEPELDLHTFRPQDIKVVVLEYLEECRLKGILEVRIVHGKGIGQLCRTVHGILATHADVISFALAAGHYGGEGATFVRLRAKPRDPLS